MLLITQYQCKFDGLTSLGYLCFANRKVEQMVEEADSLKESLDKYSMRNQRRMLEAKERAELLGRAVCKPFLFLFLFFLTIWLICYMMFFFGREFDFCDEFTLFIQNGESAHVLRIFDEEAQAMQSVRNSSRMLQESFATGTAILSKYSEQRERLKVYTMRSLSLQYLCWHRHKHKKLNALKSHLNLHGSNDNLTNAVS